MTEEETDLCLPTYDSLLEVDNFTRTVMRKETQKTMKGLVTELDIRRGVVEQYGRLLHDLRAIEKEQKHGKKKRVKGTQEWAVKNVNCCTGCSNACRYCYAQADAVRRKQVDPDQWKTVRIRTHDVLKKHSHYGGTVMFPTTHDILPENFYACIIVLENLLRAGNKVLVVSKPHYECISEICRYFRTYRNQILFRFTIGAVDNDILDFWEPGAPSYEERKACLELAFSKKFDTSVSCEPMLDYANIDLLVAELLPFVTNALWIGIMNETNRRVVIDSPLVTQNLQKIMAGQTPENLLAIYYRHKDNLKIRWKDEIKKVVGLERHTVSGLDI